MIQLNLIFVLLLLTTFARYVIFGEFEPLMFAMIFALPIASVVIFIMSKKFAKKELGYHPKNIDGWSFYHLQNTIVNKKILFKGNEQRGYIKRFFEQKWQYVIADIISSRWYLSLEIQIDEDVYTVRWYRKKWFTNQEHWHIYKNGEKVGEASTLINLKNTAKLKEAIAFRFGDASLTSVATTVTSSISLMDGERSVGGLKRNHLISNVQVIDVYENKPEYIIALIVHAFNFKNS